MALPTISMAQEDEAERYTPPSKEFYLSGHIENIYEHNKNNFIGLGFGAEYYLSKEVSISWQLGFGIPANTNNNAYAYLKITPGIYFSPHLGIAAASLAPDSCAAKAISLFVLGTALGVAIPETINFHYDITKYTTGAFYITPLLFEFNRDFDEDFNNDSFEVDRVPYGSFEIGFKFHFFDKTLPNRNSIYLGVRSPYNNPRWGIVAGLSFAF